MNIYLQRYAKLICHYKALTLEGYTETHHVIPRCMNGTDNPENLVKLTAKAHYIAHLLLTKAFPNNIKLRYAFGCMSLDPHNKRLYTSIQYAKMKEARFDTFKETIYRQELTKRALHYWRTLNESERNWRSDRVKQTFTKERRIKQSQGTKSSWLNEDIRQQRVDSLKEYYKDPSNESRLKEKRNKISNTLKKTSSFVNNNPKSKSVQTPMGIFASKRQAAKAHQTTTWKFDALLQKMPEHYFYL